MGTIDSCEYIWEAGVGFAHSPPHNSFHDQNRMELLKLLLTCFSETMYLPPVGELLTLCRKCLSEKKRECCSYKDMFYKSYHSIGLKVISFSVFTCKLNRGICTENLTLQKQERKIDYMSSIKGEEDNLEQNGTKVALVLQVVIGTAQSNVW